jgi:hypothetical protein
VIRGEAEAVGEIPGTTVNGVTVSVVQHGASLRFLLDGAQYLAVTDDALANQLDGGLIAPSGSSGEARWNRFMIMRFGQTSPTETTVPEG